MKLALHRSITFWSGIVVMAFTCWAWRDSFQHLTAAPIGERRGIIHLDGGAAFIVNRAEAHRFSSQPWNYSPEVPARRLERADWDHLNWWKVEAPFYLEKQKDEAELRAWVARGANNQAHQSNRELWMASVSQLDGPLLAVFFPHWLVLLTVAAVWLGLLVWRARRRQPVITP